MASIYKITNKINNKVYIGQTVQTIKGRWRQHVNEAYGEMKCAHLHSAIRKYGEENFTIEEIENCPQELLDGREIFWIKEYHSVEDGYNISAGGKGTNKDIPQVELEQLWDQGLSTEEIAQQVGLTRQWVRQRLSAYKNYSPTEGNLRGGRLAGKKKYQPVEQLDLDHNVINCFESIKEASEKTGITNISRSCRKGTKAGGYYWRYKLTDNS